MANRHLSKLLLQRATQFSQPAKQIFSKQIRCKSSNSTSALAYKALHRRSPLPLPVAESGPSYGAAAAVSSILYETPAVSQAPSKKHVLNCLVQNEPGVLSRISGILAARGFNIDSLVVCNTEVEDLSRMTIVLQGLDGVVEQARRQLEDLVPVWAVLDYTEAALVQRELLLAKVSILGPEVYEEIMEHHREITAPEGTGMIEENEDVERSAEQRLQELEAGSNGEQGQQKDQGMIEKARQMLGAAENYHPNRLAASQALRHKHEHLEAITHLTHQFGGKVLDISTNNCIVEVSAKPTRVDSFMKLIAPFGMSMMEQLVPEITTHALSYLDYPSLCRLSMTNSLMRKAANDDNAWKALYHKDFTLEQDSVMPVNGWKAYYAATRAVVNVNAEFFNIVRERSLPAMSRFWLDADYVKCIHASGELFSGYNSVIQSWQIAFNWEQGFDFQVQDVRARVLTDMAWVTMKTYMDIDAGPFNMTNVFEFHNGKWYLVHHHSSVMLVDGEVEQQAVHG